MGDKNSFHINHHALPNLITTADRQKNTPFNVFCLSAKATIEIVHPFVFGSQPFSTINRLVSELKLGVVRSHSFQRICELIALASID